MALGSVLDRQMVQQLVPIVGGSRSFRLSRHNGGNVRRFQPGHWLVAVVLAEALQDWPPQLLR